jgi:hypothetical protein
MDDNNNSRIVSDKKIDEMALSFSNFHALISRNDVLSANSLQKSLSDLQLMLKKVDSAFMGYNDDKVKTDKSEHYDANSESLSGSYPTSSLFPSSPFAHYSSVKLENKTGESVDLNNDPEGVDNKKNGGEAFNAQNYKNSSVTELKTLENEILGALKRLEKTKPNLELEKEK